MKFNVSVYLEVNADSHADAAAGVTVALKNTGYVKDVSTHVKD